MSLLDDFASKCVLMEKTRTPDGAGGYILSDGDYYLAIGEDSHDALNNVLAAEGYTAANGMTAEGTAAKTYSFKQSFGSMVQALTCPAATGRLPTRSSRPPWKPRRK